MPRMLTKRPAPESDSIDIPGSRCSASAAFSSGSERICSRGAMSMITGACFLTSMAWGRAPVTTTVSTLAGSFLAPSSAASAAWTLPSRTAEALAEASRAAKSCFAVICNPLRNSRRGDPLAGLGPV